VKARRNILFIHCDSMDGRVMGCMDHPAAHTPNLDRLAGRGVLMRNTYCNNPVCCPSRASMWSGQFTHHCEGWNNYQGLSPDDPTIMSRLTGAGYRCQRCGKTDYLSGAHTIRARVAAWVRSTGIDRPLYRMEGPALDDSQTERVNEGDWRDVDTCARLMKDAARGDEPFLLFCGIRAPHPPFFTSQRWLSLIDPARVPPPAQDTYDHPAMAYMRTTKNWEHGVTGDAAQFIRRIYFAMVAEVDAMAGRLIDAVDELGLADSTYVIFSSDHGEVNMEHRQFYKMNHYEGSAHVPLIVAGPDVQADVASDNLASLVDIHPTLMDMAGLPHPDGLDGHSLLPELTGGRCDRPDRVLSEFHGSTCPTGAFMLRRGQWKYIAYVGYEPLLFDLAADPDETDNLAPRRPEVVKMMDDVLRRVVDYEAVDARVKAYDRCSFRDWRRQQLEAGTYERMMARIFSGWDYLENDTTLAWPKDYEDRIVAWLDGQPGPALA